MLPLASGLPLTKFRVPRPRRDFVRRDELLERLRGQVDEYPVALVCAPAGSGKTTLMVQLVDSCDAATPCIWITLDDSDNDPVRLLATLVHSLLPLDLQWSIDPHALVANVSGSGSEARAVLAGIVNALCSATAPRILWLLDDLHQLVVRDAAGLLEALIERLPPHVSLVLGSRTEPALALARMRAHGELGELDGSHLRFDAGSVVTLARLRWGFEPAAAMVDDALRRTDGWAVGINLLIGAGRDADLSSPMLRGEVAPKALFDFLAEEVLAELSPALRDFAVDCSVLPELSPTRCAAVSPSTDSRVALDSLLRRHLFLSVVDENEPVLRFHDLFRDFLRAQLARRPLAYQRDLQARAAAVEAQPDRAIGHWLDAERWTEASALIGRHGLRLAEEGAWTQIERWIDRLPAEAAAAEPRLALLQAECAWVRWDWERVLIHAEPAARGLAQQHDLPGWSRAQLLLAASLGALGHLDERAALTERSLQSELSVSDAAQFHLQRAWSAFSLGSCDQIARHLAAMNELVASDPRRHAPQLAQTLNCHFGGLPGVTEAYLHFVDLCETIPKPAALPWHSTPIIVGAWAALWQAQRSGAEQALERAAQIQHSFGRVRYVLLDAAHLQALLLALDGQLQSARAILDGLLADLESGDAAGLRRVWQRPYRSVLARVGWIALDAEGLALQALLLAGPLRLREWPLTAGAVETVRGQAALLGGDLDAAQQALELAVAQHARYPAPAFYADPRIALAELQRRRGDAARAWATVRPVMVEIGRDNTPGRLLLEPAPIVAALLALCPATAPEAALVDSIRQRLAAWRQAAAQAGAPIGALPNAGRGLAQQLTERECEVLELVAQGLSNKLLARRLELSPHTVKRHLANILDKLDCDTRGQAADLWRRGGAG